MIDRSLEEFRVDLDDGASTLVERWGREGPLVLCIHGMTSSRKSWERTALHLRGRYRVAAYDQRGHGDSSAVTGPMTLERSVRDLENVAQSLGEMPHALIGHSWGGAVAILGGRRLSVGRVVAIDPAVRHLSADWYAGLLEEMAPTFALHGDARAALVRRDYADWPEIDRERKVHAVATMTAEPLERLRDENRAEDWDLIPALRGYPKPLLVAVADPAESIVSAEDLASMRRGGGRDVEVTVFEGEGHNLHRMAFERFARELDRFLL
jgi:pimeloyl-ACP methyl ester carboxylesterase